RRRAREQQEPGRRCHEVRRRNQGNSVDGAKRAHSRPRKCYRLYTADVHHGERRGRYCNSSRTWLCNSAADRHRSHKPCFIRGSPAEASCRREEREGETTCGRQGKATRRSVEERKGSRSNRKSSGSGIQNQ